MPDLGQPQVQIAMEEWCPFLLLLQYIGQAILVSTLSSLILSENDAKVVDSNSSLQCLLRLDMSLC